MKLATLILLLSSLGFSQTSGLYTAGMAWNSSTQAAIITLIGITMTPSPTVAGNVGSSINFVATGVYSDASQKPVTSTCVFSDTNPSVASLGAGGSSPMPVQILTAGTTSIKCTIGTIQSSNTVLTGVAVVGMKINETSLPNGKVGNAYSTTLSQSNGTLPVTWSLSSPCAGLTSEGLTFSSGGTLSGTPTTPTGSTPISCQYQVVDSSGTPKLATATLPLTITAVTLSSIVVSTPFPTFVQNNQADFTALGTYSDGTTNDVTTQCIWTTTNSAIATLGVAGSSPQTITGVGVGTAGIGCHVGAITSANVTLTILAFQVTTTTLPNGINGTAYNVTLQSNGGTLPTTWDCPSGCGGGLTITGSNVVLNATTGVLSSANPTVGSYTFTVRATDTTPTTPNVDSQVLTLVVTGASACGPPTYNCSLITTAQIPAPALPASLLDLTADATGAVGVNRTANVRNAGFPTTSGVGNCITRLTDKNTSGNASVGGTPSGGAGDNIWSLNRDYTGWTMGGGTFYFASISYDAAGCAQINNPNISASAKVPGTSGVAASRVTNNVFFHVDSTTGSKVRLMRDVVSGTNPVTVVSTLFFDFATCPGFPANFIGTWGSALHTSLGDTVFSSEASNVGGQNTGYWAMAYKPGTGCTTYFTGPLTAAAIGYGPPAGNVWAFCSGACQQGGANQAAPLGTETTCSATTGFGLHGGQMYRDGLAMNMSGTCNGVTNSMTVWDIGTLNVRTCSQSVNNCGGHDSAGYNHLMTTSSGSWLLRSKSDLTTPTVFFTSPQSTNWLDHGSWHWNDTTDDKPRLDSIAACATNVVYCNEIFAIKMNGTTPRFTANFNVPSTYFRAQDGISAASQDGYCIQWATTGNDKFGIDNAGKPRAEILAVCNLQ